jgi:hypothetical protein
LNRVGCSVCFVQGVHVDFGAAMAVISIWKTTPEKTVVFVPLRRFKSIFEATSPPHNYLHVRQ